MKRTIRIIVVLISIIFMGVACYNAPKIKEMKINAIGNGELNQIVDRLREEKNLIFTLPSYNEIIEESLVSYSPVDKVYLLLPVVAN